MDVEWIANYAVVAAGTALFALFFVLNGRRDCSRSVDAEYMAPTQAGRFAAEAWEVIDGDTVRVQYYGNWFSIRLHGIDAPELKQTSILTNVSQRPRFIGYEAKEALTRYVSSTRLEVEIKDWDKYGRAVGVLTTEHHANVNRAMVQSGWAQAYLQYGGNIYARDEEEARQASRGIWTCKHISPWHWRSIYK